MSNSRLAAAAVLAGLLLGRAVSSPPQVVFPTTPKAEPVPVKPVDLTLIPADHLYVFTSDTPVVVLASPDNVVKVEEEAGPVRVVGKFVGGTGRTETKKFAAKQVFIVQGLQSGPVELLIVPVGLKGPGDVLRKRLEVDDGTGPRPPPPKPVEPDPKTKPGEIPADGLHVLILYDPNGPMPARQQSILDGAATRDWLEKNCTPGPDGKHRQYRIWPHNVDGYADSRLWGDAQKLRKDSDPLPWLLISNGKKGGYKGPLPGDPAAFLKEAERYR